MIDWINRTFGIDNSVSIPTIISIIVFLTGGIASFLFLRITEYRKRKTLRKTFVLLINEVIKNLKRKEQNLKEFYPQISLTHEEGWFLPHKTVSYLDTIFEMDFNSLYHAFRKKFYWRCCPAQISTKAFHRVWGILRDLKFLEQSINQHIDGLPQRFGKYHERYGDKLDTFRKFHDELAAKTEGMVVTDENKEEAEYLQAQDRIWYDWQQLDESNRTHFHTTYTNLVVPSLALNKKYQQLPYILDSNNILLECTHQYIEIENTLRVYNKVFKDYFWSYRHAHLLLAKSLEIID